MDSTHYVTPEEADRMTCVVNPAEHFCNGPNCMAWRWEIKSSPLINWAASKFQPHPEPNWIRVGDHPYADLIPDRETGVFIVGTGKGYCGMVRS